MATDRIWGIERNKHSPLYGKKVVTVALLWDKPAPKNATPDHVTGALKHGDLVEVLETKKKKGLLWCLAEKAVEKDGVIYWQRGWLRASLLKDAGLVELEKEDEDA